MDAGICYRVLSCVATVPLVLTMVWIASGDSLLAAPVGPATTEQDTLPPAVTQALITEGSRLFTGAGLCLACHGPNAKGLPNLGPDLTDTTWVHIDGSFEQIVEQINKGVTAGDSKSGLPMPPRGGSGLNEEQVRAVAAYVWSLSRSSGG